MKGGGRVCQSDAMKKTQLAITLKVERGQAKEC